MKLFVPVERLFKCRCGHKVVKLTAPMQSALLSTDSMNVVERAFELARTGQFQYLDELIEALSREGYGVPRIHFSSSPTLRAQIREKIRVARLPKKRPRCPVEAAQVRLSSP